MVRLFNEPQLLIATGNKGKLREFEALLHPLNINCVSLDAFPDIEEPEETGDTFEENALIKARYYAAHTKLPALADDSGLVIPRINNQPGIYSARWAGPSKDFTVAMNKVEHTFKTTYGDDYVIRDPAYFACCLVLFWPEDGHHETVEGHTHGTLSFPPRGKEGFGYDPIFVPQHYDKTFAECSLEEKQAISHRSNAIAQLLERCFSSSLNQQATC